MPEAVKPKIHLINLNIFFFKKKIILIDAARLDTFGFFFLCETSEKNWRISLFSPYGEISCIFFYRCQEEPVPALIPLRLHQPWLSFQGLGTRFQTSASASTTLDETRRGDIPHIDHANIEKELLCLCVGGGTKKKKIQYVRVDLV